MKKKYLLLLLLLLIPIKVKAASIGITCDSTLVDAGSSVTCKVTAYDSKVSGAKASISVTNGTILSVSSLSSSEICSPDKNGFVCVDEERDNSYPVASYTIQVGSSGTTTIRAYSAEVVGVDYNTIQVSDASASITIREKAPETAPVQTPQQEQTNNNSQTTNQVTTSEETPQTNEEENKEEVKEEVPRVDEPITVAEPSSNSSNAKEEISKLLKKIKNLKPIEIYAIAITIIFLIYLVHNETKSKKTKEKGQNNLHNIDNNINVN